MEKINWRRVVLGGMLAGMVLALLDTIFLAIFRHPGLRTPIQGINPATNGMVTALFNMFAFIFLGILMIWSYAAIRPCFGPGPKTAVIAGFAVFLVAVSQLLLRVAMYDTVSDLPPGPMLPMLYLLTIVAGTQAGAWVYKAKE